MKIGILSDAHANPYTLNRCIKVLQDMKVKKIFHLGDSIGYFMEPSDVLKKLESINAVCLMGNHEAMLLGYLNFDENRNEIYKITENSCKISQQQFKKISRWLPFCEEKINGRRLLFVHGSPWNPVNGYIYPDSDIDRFANLPFDAVFMGHTHRPFVSLKGKVLVVNVGSCSLSRDQGNMLSCAVYDSNQNICQILRIQIDIDQIIQKYKTVNKVVIDCLMRKSTKEPFGYKVKLEK